MATKLSKRTLWVFGTLILAVLSAVGFKTVRQQPMADNSDNKPLMQVVDASYGQGRLA